MAKEDDAASKRILYIEERQAALIRAAESLQGSLLARLTAVVGAIQKSPDPAIDAVFDAFERDEASKVVLQFAKDIVGIGRLNAEYFGTVAALPARDYRQIQTTAESYLLKRFGLGKDGKPVKNGFLESFITDPTVRRQVKQYAYRTKGSGAGLVEFTKGLGDLVTGSAQSAGPIVRYYKTYALDTYQQADREIQEQAAERLGMSAFIYAGGLIKSSRNFCVVKNGKVFTRAEALAWKDLEFDGKPTNYDPLRDLGGYGCRHHKNYITDAMAIKRRPELADVLKGKPGTKAPEAAKEEEVVVDPDKFAPAKTIREAEQYAVDKGFAKQADFRLATVEQANAINERVDELHRTYKLAPMDYLSVRKSGDGIPDSAGGAYSRTRSGDFAEIKLNANVLKPVAAIDYKARADKALAEWEKIAVERPNLFAGQSAAAKGNREKLRIIRDEAKFERWTVRPLDLDGTLVHEYGHKLHDDIAGIDSSITRKNKAAVSAMVADDLNDALRDAYFGAIQNGEIYKLSAYSKTNHKEFFAEAFTQYTLNPNDLPPGIRSFMKTFLSHARF